MATVTVASNGATVALTLRGLTLFPGTSNYGEIRHRLPFDDFQGQPIGATFRKRVAHTNGGSFARAINAISARGPAAQDYHVAQTTCIGKAISATAHCTVGVDFAASASGWRFAERVVEAQGFVPEWCVALGGSGGTSVAAEPPLVDVVEYYQRGLDHCLIRSLDDDIKALDSGALSGWMRTGYSLRALVSAQPGSSGVCRFYIPPELGKSHFEGRNATECAATATKNPTFVGESPRVMDMIVPKLGVCPAGTLEVHRVFSARADANRRHTILRSVRNDMVQAGLGGRGRRPRSRRRARARVNGDRRCPRAPGAAGAARMWHRARRHSRYCRTSAVARRPTHASHP